jgi:hypothetical protein
MRSALVVVVDPGLDDALGFSERLESMLPDALELKRSHERFYRRGAFSHGAFETRWT